MSNVEFNEESVTRVHTNAKDPLFVRILLRYGIGKTRRDAEMVLIGIAILALVLAVVVFPKGRPVPSNDIQGPGPSAQQVP